jgi:hypothetical protein
MPTIKQGGWGWGKGKWWFAIDEEKSALLWVEKGGIEKKYSNKVSGRSPSSGRRIWNSIKSATIGRLQQQLERKYSTRRRN